MSNVVALKGRLGAQIIRESNLCGLQYDHYELSIETTRKSGVTDSANIVIPASKEKEVKEIIEQAALTPDVAVMCTGKLQTLKDWESGRVLLYVLADFVGLLTGDNWEEENEVHIEAAALGKRPTYRETPRGKHIADATLKIPNELKPQSFCYIPTIFWEKDAELINEYTEGDVVTVTGRLQSRGYTKKIDEGLEELRVAYELSVSSVDVSANWETEDVYKGE